MDHCYLSRQVPKNGADGKDKGGRKAGEGDNGRKAGRGGQEPKSGKLPVLSLAGLAVALMFSNPCAGTGVIRDTIDTPVDIDSTGTRSATAARLRLELDTLGKRIDSLKARLSQAGSKAGDKAKQAGDKVKRETREELAALERARERLSAGIDSLGEASSDAWFRMKTRAKSGLDSLKAEVEAEVDRVRDRFRD